MLEQCSSRAGRVVAVLQTVPQDTQKRNDKLDELVGKLGGTPPPSRTSQRT